VKLSSSLKQSNKVLFPKTLSQNSTLSPLPLKEFYSNKVVSELKDPKDGE